MPLQSQIESLLFVATKPVAAKELAELLQVEPELVSEAIDALAASYQASGSGLQIVKNNSKYQMMSASENAELVQKFINDATSGELSRPSLETLTIIAYRGPIAKMEIERLRGVNCSLIIRNLLLRGLIEEKVDKEKDESYYTVTMDFVRFLGIGSINELPEYAKLSHDERLDKALEATEPLLSC
jgi:segregation and condensation protein B